MKIAYVYDAVYPWVKGGAEKRIYEISRRLATRGHEVHCYGMKWWQGQDDIEMEGVQLHGICPSRPLYCNGKRSIKEAAYFARRLLAVRTNCEVLDCQNFPYLPCFSAKLISQLQGPKLFITWLEVWGQYWQEYLGEKGRVGQTVEWAAARLTDRVKKGVVFMPFHFPGTNILTAETVDPEARIPEFKVSACKIARRE